MALKNILLTQNDGQKNEGTLALPCNFLQVLLFVFFKFI